MFNISFTFNEETKKVSNIKCIQIKEAPEYISSNGEPIVELSDNKIRLSPETVILLKASIGDRITINYYQVSNEESFPVIGKSEYFTDINAGNKLTKSNTVSFRGKQQTILSDYGSVFKLAPFKDNIFKLVPVNEDSSLEIPEEVINDMELSQQDLDNFCDLDNLPFE